VIVLIAGAKDDSYAKVDSKISSSGGRVTTGMPPGALYALIPPDKEAELKSVPGVKILSSKPVDLKECDGCTDQQKKILEEWNQSFSSTRPIPNLPPPPGDARTKPPTGQDKPAPRPPKDVPK
jgi:hypothetical protein